MNTTEPATPSRSLPRVLIVDDDEAQLRALTRALGTKGYEIRTANSAAQALEQIAEAPVEVLVTDLSMPGAGGMDLIRTIREVDLDLPVIVLTGHPDLESASEAVALRAFRYFTKPVDMAALDEAIDRAATTYRLVNLKRDAAESFDVAGAHVDERFRAGIEGLWMAYQPILDARTGRIYGHEALVRTTEKSIPHPGVFLELARGLGTVQQLGRMVRSRVVVDVQTKGHEGAVFVNLTVADLVDPNLFATEAPLSRIADRVVLELTEREGLDTVPDLARRVERLRQVGYRIAVDDLGAGYSALSYFAMLEPEIVKLDMSLVRGIHEAPVKRRTVASLTDLAHSLGILVVAEGIETVEEHRVLSSIGVDHLQGFLFARPAEPFPAARWPDPAS